MFDLCAVITITHKVYLFSSVLSQQSVKIVWSVSVEWSHVCKFLVLWFWGWLCSLCIHGAYLDPLRCCVTMVGSKNDRLCIINNDRDCTRIPVSYDFLLSLTHMVRRIISFLFSLSSLNGWLGRDLWKKKKKKLNLLLFLYFSSTKSLIQTKTL